jgi:hypothetical protein
MFTITNRPERRKDMVRTALNATIGGTMRRFLMLGVVVFTACHRSPPPPSRVLHVRVAADEAFRQRSDWRQVASSRIEAVSRMYELDFNIRFEPSGNAAEWAPQPAGAEDRRRALLGIQTDGNWLFLGFTGPDPAAAEPGIAVPFDNRVLVFHDPEKSDIENTANLAHLIGHVFGAWHSPDGKSIMHLPPGSQFDITSLNCIRAMRTFDTRSGAKAMPPEGQSKVNELLASTKAPPGANPFFQHFTAMGYELMSMGMLQQAVDPLSRAAKIADSEPAPHYALATTFMLMRRYPSSAVEFRKVAALEPGSAAALERFARGLLESGRPGLLMASLRGGEAAADSASFHAQLGMTLAATHGQIDEGIEELRFALRLNPDDSKAKAALEAALAAKASGRN